jgi:hypothetical protein
VVTLTPLSASQVRLCARCCALLRLPPEPPGYFQAYLAGRLARHDPALLDLGQLLTPGEVRRGRFAPGGSAKESDGTSND